MGRLETRFDVWVTHSRPILNLGDIEDERINIFRSMGCDNSSGMLYWWGNNSICDRVLD